LSNTICLLKYIFQGPFNLAAIEPDETLQKVVENGNNVSIQSTFMLQGKKRSLRSTKSQNKAKYSVKDELLAIMRDIQGEKSVRDQYALFGEQVGMQIRDLPTPYSRKVVKQIINTVLFDAEMGKYDYPSTISSQPYPEPHLYANFGTQIPSNPLPFPSPSKISTPMVSPASLIDGPGTNDS
jgi:hypothetical protein